jgi:hypothetical protein
MSLTIGTPSSAVVVLFVVVTSMVFSVVSVVGIYNNLALYDNSGLVFVSLLVELPLPLPVPPPLPPPLPYIVGCG